MNAEAASRTPSEAGLREYHAAVAVCAGELAAALASGRVVLTETSAYYEQQWAPLGGCVAVYVGQITRVHATFIDWEEFDEDPLDGQDAFEWRYCEYHVLDANTPPRRI